MAQPIKETPVLMGEDARRFEDDIKANENTEVNREELQKAKDAYQRFEID